MRTNKNQEPFAQRRMLSIRIACLCLLVYAGICSAASNKLAAEKFDVTKVPGDSAIVIMSSGAVSRCLATGTELNVARAGSAFRSHVLFEINVDNFFIKSDYPDHQGSLSVFALKAGEYELYPSWLNPFVNPTKVPRAEFTVAAGEIVYIGEFFMTESCRWATLQELRDEESRDMALLEVRNPKLAALPRVKRMAKFTGLIVDDAE